MLDDSDEDGTGASRLLTPKEEPGTGGDGAGCSAPAPPTGGDSDDDSSDGGDYTRFYRHFGM